MIPACRREPAAVGTEGDGLNRLAMGDAAHLLAAPSLDQSYGVVITRLSYIPVPAGRCQPAAVGAEGYQQNLPTMSDTGNLSAARSLHQSRRIVLTPSCQEATVGTKGDQMEH